MISLKSLPCLRHSSRARQSGPVPKRNLESITPKTLTHTRFLHERKIEGVRISKWTLMTLTRTRSSNSVLRSVRSTSNLRVAYNRLAPLYDLIVPAISREPRRLGESWLRPKNGETLLEIGVGTGRSFRRLAAASPDGWSEGIDVSSAMLARARERMRHAQHRRFGLRRTCAQTLPYPPNTFEALFCSYMVDVVSTVDRDRILREIRRVLHPRGRAVFVYLSAPQQPLESLWASICRRAPVLVGGARPIDLHSPLVRLGFRIQNHTSRAQAGLRSSITMVTLD